MNRRNFIRHAVAASAAIALAPKILFAQPERYILYGDGVHDDTQTLQAWLDGKPVYDANGRLLGNYLRRGTFRMTEGITFKNADNHHITNCHLKFERSSSDVLIDMGDNPNNSLTYSYIQRCNWN